MEGSASSPARAADACGPISKCGPWWREPLRLEQCAERPSSSAGAGPCSIRMLEAIDCRVEPGADGKAYRRCQRIVRKFLECPGRPCEEIETLVTQSDLGESDPFPGMRPEQAPAVLQPHIGEAFDEFFRLAEELSKQLSDEGNGAAAEAAAVAAQQRAKQQQEAPAGMLNWLFGRPKAQKGDAAGAQKPAWGEFEKSFEEV